MKKGDIAIVAIWFGGALGLIEGLLLYIARFFPVLLAPYKLSSPVIWVTPLIDIALSLLLGIGLATLLRVFGKWLKGQEALLVVGIYTWVGLFSILAALKLITYLSAVILSLGITIFIIRLLKGKERDLIAWLRRRIIWVPIGIGALAIGVTAMTASREYLLAKRLPEPVDNAPNVLLVVMDTVRYDRFVKGSDDLTPTLNRLAQQGARYENAWTTASWSLPSQASILTGLYPSEHQADWPGFDLREDVTTLPEYFSSLGYVTGAFSGNSSWVTPEYLHDDFLRFQVYIWQDYIRRTTFGRPIDQLLAGLGLHYAGLGKKAPQVNQEVVNFMDRYPDHPYFLYLCYMDVNQGFHHKELNHPFWEDNPPVAEIADAYDESLITLDSEIADLLNHIEARGGLDNTLIIITSDHGESFGEEYPGDHLPEGHGTSLYPEQSRIPLFLVYPGKILPGQVQDQSVSLQEIAKTITELLGFEEAPFPGTGLPIATLENSAESQSKAAVFITLNYDQYKSRSVVQDDWQFLRNFCSSEVVDELFNLSGDPTAQTNLLSKEPETTRLKTLLSNWLDTATKNTAQKP
jgi:arylsulfatase A-like enzyme